MAGCSTPCCCKCSCLLLRAWCRCPVYSSSRLAAGTVHPSSPSQVSSPGGLGTPLVVICWTDWLFPPCLHPPACPQPPGTLVTQSLASVCCLSSLFSSALNCGVPAHTIEFVLNFQLFGFSKSINQAFLTKRPVRVFGIVAKYCNCESPWLFFVCLF